MSVLAEAYLGQGPPRELYAFLERSFGELQLQHGRVVGLRAPIPKMLPLPGPNSGRVA